MAHVWVQATLRVSTWSVEDVTREHSQPTAADDVSSIFHTMRVATGAVAEGLPRSSDEARLPMVQWRNIFVLFDRGAALPHDYALATQLILEQARHCPRGLGALTVWPAALPVPHESIRRAILGAYQTLAPHLRGAAFILEGEDFRAAAVRAALAGIHLALRHPYPVRVERNLPTAVGWLLMQVQSGSMRPVDAGELLAAINDRRNHLRTLNDEWA